MVLQCDVDHHRACAGLGARVDSHDRAERGLRESVDAECDRLANLNLGDVFGRDGSFELDARQIDDLDELGVHRDALARLCEALRHDSGDRRDEQCIGATLARDFDGRRGSFVSRLR